jgi:hypothetical protein
MSAGKQKSWAYRNNEDGAEIIVRANAPIDAAEVVKLLRKTASYVEIAECPEVEFPEQPQCVVIY